MRRLTTILTLILLTVITAKGQVYIGGQVYGGGNHGNVNGKTSVTVKEGDINKVFGGARMANVGGSSYVNIDGAHATGYTVINYVFGGNDISGNVGTARAIGDTIPTELFGNKDSVDGTWNSYVHISTKTEVVAGKIKQTADAEKAFIGQVFAGGNGGYDYEIAIDEETGDTIHKIFDLPRKNGDMPIAYNTAGYNYPELNKTYLDIQGGTIAFAYGGGNKATVKERAVIHVDNPSEVVSQIYVNASNEEVDKASAADSLLTDERIQDDMGIRMAQEHIESTDFQIGRLFGGNNLAEMAIRPTWNLLSGKVRNLYSGGNKGSMTSPDGLLLEIADTSTIVVDNLFGGCRMADVCPKVNGIYTPTKNLKGYNFPDELSARVLVRGGDVNNVYGGNDVTGKVYGGNALGIYTTVRGNVYGGGNGAYAYTDNDGMEDDETYGDVYYSQQGFSTSYDALNAFRPNAEQVSIRLAGSGPRDMTIIKGSVYVGGNCATLSTVKNNPLVELKIGSYVVADTVFMGNNGSMMVNPDVLRLYADKSFSSLDLTDASVFANYMEGVAMNLQPSIVFDRVMNGDPANYIDNSSYVGSFYFGGNRGSMTIPGKNIFRISRGLNIYEKLVGGCNNAYIPATAYNAAYDGGVIGAKDERPEYTDNEGKPKDRLEIDLENMTITPLRWDEGRLIWNTAKWDIEKKDFVNVPNSDAYDVNKRDSVRLLGGNVYGGCYNSGHINGNVIININEDVLKRDEVFGTEMGPYGRRASGVELEKQRTDQLAVSLSVFGGGYGDDTEIWGSSTVNLNKGYVFQIFGGGEKGVIGKNDGEFNPIYSATVNLNGSKAVFSSDTQDEDLAETEFIYGGGSEGDVNGNTYVNLGNGRIYDVFGGASDADILGHTEVYIGRQPKGDGTYKDGFPWITDIVYGGNDFGGTIYGAFEDGYDFTKRVKDYATDKAMIHGYKDGKIPNVLKGTTYVEYLQGRVDSIFGGSYGYYDYTNTALYGDDATMPVQESAYINIRPKVHEENVIKGVFGGGTGYPGVRKNDIAQNRSYILIDIPEGVKKFENTEVFGAGSYNGLGMKHSYKETTAEGFDLDGVSAIIDLLHGQIGTTYGGSYNEGITRRTVVNVPALSTIKIKDIFGGAYGTQILPPCDVYESNVNYRNTSEKARLTGSIYGGNNNERRTLYTKVNISSPVWSNKESGYLATVYGAGRGVDTWSEYTEVNLESGAKVYGVYGGGEMGHVLNAESVQKYMQLFKDGPSPQISTQDPKWSKADNWVGGIVGGTLKSDASITKAWADDWEDAWKIGQYYSPNATFTNYVANDSTNLTRISARAELDNTTAALLHGAKHNSNVIINSGAEVTGYAYGGGLGDANVERSGDVYGTTYIALLGGVVDKDVYAAGKAGGLDNLFGAENFMASANAYIQGGMARNVYGGGYLGHVGHHVGDIIADYSGDRLAESSVVIGKFGTNTFEGGAPAIMRNAYGGGEGGSIYGTAKLTINNGYVGYRYKNTGTELDPVYQYVEELDDAQPKDIELAGNVFGGGYVINSYVDTAIVNLYGGTIRGNVYGGGEIGPLGRGTMKEGVAGGMQNGNATIFKAGKSTINMYSGHVLRNVFGGGRGKDSWGGDGTKYMDPKLVATLDMKCKGYVFGQTEVNIFGGEIGTDEGVTLGYGNVFGAGDEGVVYSAYHDNEGHLQIGKKDGVRYDGLYEGYYFKWDGTNFLTHDGGERYFTEDCKVLVEPHCKSSAPLTINGHTYASGEYIPTSALNKLKGKQEAASYWVNIDSTGVIIHNAVFAGGNIAPGSSSMYANEKTVFGNATASIHDIYNRDLITIGTGHTGGLYGDGNLTFVDGYRELNITNYGTDYYHIDKQLTLDAYKLLQPREKAYYELKYKCLTPCTDIEGTTYSAGSNLPQDELMVLFTNEDGTSVQVNGVDVITTIAGKKVPNPAIWQENGVVSIYAGRIMNTIQRADLCGVFGSRMVMKGARDRVPEVVDYTNYTINRVREVSLNKMDTQAGDTDDDNKLHGNYFGIYSIVNHLGALTSDVKFDTLRTTKADTLAYPGLKPDGKTFSEWKEAHKDDRTRNNGTCHNHLALASGVYLELTTEKSTGTGLYEKDWGQITGVVELDLINVQPGVGGGFVYAKNEHGVPSLSGIKSTTLTALNKNAVTKWDYTYDTSDATKKEWQTSGNFIHSSQTIIDDCYNIGSKYLSTDGVPAHYWFISGLVYVYDQYISAYTGSPNAYSKTVEIPITINAASHGTMTLMDVQPNLYAYYSSYTDAVNNTPLEGERKLVINDVTYQLNDPISYWDWSKLSKAEQKLFVEDTYVTVAGCKINGDTIYAGTVMLPSTYNAYLAAAQTKIIDEESVKAVTSNGKDVPFTSVFRSSNNMSHTTGYLLTYNMTNPSLWTPWFTKVNSSTREKNQTGFDVAYEDGPTYHPTQNGIFGRHYYNVTDIISKEVYKTYQDAVISHSLNLPDSASFEKAYITKEYLEVTDKKGIEQHIQERSALAKSDYQTAEWTSISSKVAEAFVCTSTIQLSDENYIYINDLLTEAEKNTYISNVNTEIRKLRTVEKLSDARLAEVTKYADLTTAEKAGLTAEQEKSLAQLLTLRTDMKNNIVPAYYCTKEGYYGGDYYETGKNYRALSAWSSMSADDRENFTFNYDALDLLIDPTYGKTNGVREKEGKKYQYDSEAADHAGAEANAAHYSLKTTIDYTATYYGDTDLYYTPDEGGAQVNAKLAEHKELSRSEYESLPNERRHYAAIKVNQPGDYYVVHTDFVHVETPYAVGSVIDEDVFSKLSTSEKANLDTLTFTAEDIVNDGSGNPLPYYYCRENYQVIADVNSVSQAVTDVKDGNHVYTAGNEVPVGAVITSANYANLANKQLNFTIHGVSPMETSTLFVSRNSDIYDLSTEKVITVIYKYDYEESDADGTHITPVSERHIVNIHVTFKSGVPTVEDIQEPGIVLPGTSITMRIPSVTPGAYEVTGGGWEIFERENYAESHTNGVEYSPSSDPLYWYQDGFYLAYYAKTYLGKTYSNHVPISVANYHDLKKVMEDHQNHLFVDYDRTRLKRNSKVYINDYSSSDENGLDLLKDFYDLSLITNTTPGITLDHDTITNAGRLRGQTLLNNSTEEATLTDGTTVKRGVKGGENLEFFLRTDINHTDSWTPIGSDEQCFEGNIHGDGHTISGLNNSLFNNLCGNVYNLGVTGSFNSAGVVDKGDGYVESCWVKTSGTPTGTVNAVFGTPSAAAGTKQIVNSYYQDTKSYKTTDDNAHGLATPMAEQAFYNGTVAYDLNNFYLYKRYNDNAKPAGSTTYKYWIQGNATPQEGRYAQNETLCSSGYNGLKYVEDRFEDGDFRYAAGTIPTWDDERLYTETIIEEGQTLQTRHFYPIWPDDYIFFGQKLTYGYSLTQQHQDVPTAVVRDGGRLSLEANANRVYRAPAYYRSKAMEVVHFNPDAYLAQKKAKTNLAYADTLAYPNMTAIDFADHKYGSYETYKSYMKGMNAVTVDARTTDLFYPPVLDDDGLTSITNCDETKNLLVYAPAEEAESGYANKNTFDVLTSYFTDPAYEEYYDNSNGYRLVDACAASVNGHLVQNDLTAINDHLLIDEQDFNAPISYRFDNDHRMWYQRLPGDLEYVDREKGWQAISLPFTSELVTTHQKGEITHFYSASETSKNGTDSKIGHEYWLREFKDITVRTVNETPVAYADFTYPTATGADKNATNTFLWDYYYKNEPVHNQKDANDDTYLQYKQYYETGRTHTAYPLLTAATPYIIGLPGQTYYEFDLSGKFQAQHTATTIDKLEKQTVTFASAPNIRIAVSDDETVGVTQPYSGMNYTFKPSYMNMSLEAGTNSYTLNATGDSCNKVPASGAATKVRAFRPYFTATASESRRYLPEHIVFSSVSDSFGEEYKNEESGDGALSIMSRLRHIIVKSTLKAPKKVTIHNAAGISIATFTIEPGQTIETLVNMPGFYIVNKTKIAVR